MILNIDRDMLLEINVYCSKTAATLEGIPDIYPIPKSEAGSGINKYIRGIRTIIKNIIAKEIFLLISVKYIK
ncbi:hypothetical protein KAX35_06775 [candidate division WOR-3 bacterium]|nr:hypothetical protein [candidate division WOR-3 bacterium]